MLGPVDFGDRPWRLSGEKVCAIHGDPRGERLHWNVFFLLVNARTRPMRDGERWNFFSTSLRFVWSLFEPPIRELESGRSPSGREIGGKNSENRKKVVSACSAAVKSQKPPQTWPFFGLVFLHNSAVDCSPGRPFFFFSRLVDFSPAPARSWGPGRTSDQYERLK